MWNICETSMKQALSWRHSRKKSSSDQKHIKTAVLEAFLHWGCCIVTLTVHSVGPECCPRKCNKINEQEGSQEGIAYAMFHSYREFNAHTFEYLWFCHSFFGTRLLSMLMSVHCWKLPAVSSHHFSRIWSSRVAIDIHQLKGRMLRRSQV